MQKTIRNNITRFFYLPGKEEIAIRTVEECLERGSKIERVIFNVFKPEDERYYLDQLAQR